MHAAIGRLEVYFYSIDTSVWELQSGGDDLQDMTSKSLAEDTWEERFLLGSAVNGCSRTEFKALVMSKSVLCDDVAMLVNCILRCNIDRS